MRLRIEVTQADIAKAKTHWRYDCPIYHAVVRQTGCPNVEVKHNVLIVHWGRSRYGMRGLHYALPAEATKRIERYYQGEAAQRHMEPFAFDLELDRRGMKLLGLHPPCTRCGDYPRERASDLCVVCQEYRETMLNLWR